MAIGNRLKMLRAAAEARGPLDDFEDEPAPELPRKLFPVTPLPEVVLPENDAARAEACGHCYGLDVESFLIQPGRKVPRLVVTGYQHADGRQAIVTGDPDDPRAHALAFLAFTSEIIKRARASEVLLDAGTVIDVGARAPAPIGSKFAPAPKVVYSSTRGLLTNQNIPFDFCVIAEDAHQADLELEAEAERAGAPRKIVGTPESLHEQVMRRIFDLLDLGLVEDPMLRERLIDIAEGTLDKDWTSLTEGGNPRKKRYNLKDQSQRYLDLELDKLSWRTGYYRFYKMDISAYPEGARLYLTTDVTAALQVAERQQQRAEAHGLPPGTRIPNSAEQTQAAWALSLVSAWGMRTSRSKVQSLDADTDKWQRRLFNVLKKTGLIKSDGVRDIKLARKLVEKAYSDAGLPVPMTKKKKDGSGGGNISLAGAVLEDVAFIRLRKQGVVIDENGTIDEEGLGLFEEPLYAYSQYTRIDKIRGTYLPVLYSGVDYPICGSFETIRETGRTSMYGPNLQNLYRGSPKTMLGRLQLLVRECFVPRPGYVFCTVDYDTLELATFAQVCLWLVGHSKLADALNAGMDPHLLMAAEQFLCIMYEEAKRRKKEVDVKEMRQFCKPINFAAAGGLGPNSYVDYAKGYGIHVTIEEARDALERYRMQWPEAREYFRIIANMMRGYDEYGREVGDLEQFVSGRIRGKVRYTAACNSFFQGLAADGAKAALYEICRHCYLQGGRMYGARPVAFIHDEIICELPIDVADEYARAQGDIMVSVMQQVCPDVKINATPALMECWQKNAEAVYDKRGRLIPWQPEATA